MPLHHPHSPRPEGSAHGLAIGISCTRVMNKKTKKTHIAPPTSLNTANEMLILFIYCTSSAWPAFGFIISQAVAYGEHVAYLQAPVLCISNCSVTRSYGTRKIAGHAKPTPCADHLKAGYSGNRLFNKILISHPHVKSTCYQLKNIF